jgi:hypothetical protein
VCSPFDERTFPERFVWSAKAVGLPDEFNNRIIFQNEKLVVHRGMEEC